MSTTNHTTTEQAALNAKLLPVKQCLEKGEKLSLAEGLNWVRNGKEEVQKQKDVRRSRLEVVD